MKKTLVAILLIHYVPFLRADHLSREDPVEPFFTERAFLEKNLEMDIDIENDSDGENLAFSPGTTWVFYNWLQLGMEIPYQVSIPDQGATLSALSDIGLSVKVLLCCDTETGYTFLSVRGDVEIPSGDRSKDIGGDGSFGFSLVAGHGFTVFPSLEDLTVQVELAYSQQIRLTNEQLSLAEQFNLPDSREKAFIWNIAFAQKLAGGRFSPVLEVLGTSVVDALTDDDQGTIVKLGIGSWFVPFSDDHTLSNFSIGVGWNWPLTRFRDNEGEGVVIFELAFD